MNTGTADVDGADGAEGRFARQRMIPAWDQDRIGAASAVVIGVGALGNEVAKNLALLGFGRLILCDPDTVAQSNLSRTVLFGPDDVGRSKVDSAVAGLARLSPRLVVDGRCDDLVRGVGLGELADAHVVLGCLDSRQARLQLLGRCALAQARLVDGGTHPWGGEVRVRVDTAQACWSCTLSAGQRAERDAPVGCQPEPAQVHLPASIVSTSLVAGWMTTAAVRIVLDAALPWRLLDIDAANAVTGPVVATFDPTCPFHRPMRDVRQLGVDNSGSVGDLLSVLPAEADPLTWTVFPVSGFCYQCSRPCPVDHSYREGTVECLNCGGRVRLRFSQHIRDADAGTRLVDLGVAPRDILAVRLPEGDYQWFGLRASDQARSSRPAGRYPRTSS